MTAAPSASISVKPAKPADLPWTVLAWIAAAALMILTHPYGGIDGDARLYIGSALATIDPQGVGQDLMFRHDGQFGFSLYPALLVPLVRTLGPSAAALLLSGAGLAAWLGGAAALARSLAGPGRRGAGFAVLVCIIALPALYGGFSAFTYGEILAVPRPFAEGAVMAGLAAMILRRPWLAVALVLVGALFHPIMALPGLAAIVLMLALERPIWLAAPLIGALAVVLAGVLGAPLASRLVTPIDPQWLAVLRERGADLFPSQWPMESWGRIAVHLSTVLIAASLTVGRTRAAFLAVAAAAIAGLLLSLVFGDRWPMLLVVQVQSWRMLWLLALAANAGLVIVGIALVRGDAGAKLLLAAIAVAWMTVDAPTACITAAVFCLSLQAARLRGARISLTPLTVQAVTGAVAVLALFWLGQRAISLTGFFTAAWRAGVHPGWPYLIAAEIQALPIAALAIALPVYGPRLGRTAFGLVTVLAVGGAIAACALWDGRLTSRHQIDTLGVPPALSAAIGPAPGAVAWIGGDTEAWLLAGRASWANRMQAGGAVFSRDLALNWQARIEALKALGMASQGDLAPFTAGVGVRPRLAPSPQDVAALCARPDGPVAVIIADGSTPAGFDDRLWRPPVAAEILSSEGGQFSWRRIRDYAVIRCRS